MFNATPKAACAFPPHGHEPSSAGFPPSPDFSKAGFIQFCRIDRYRLRRYDACVRLPASPASANRRALCQICDSHENWHGCAQEADDNLM